MLPNYVSVNDALATGAQPSLEGLEELKNRGFTALLNLSPSSTPNFLPREGAEAEKLGLRYVHYPVDCTRLYPEQYRLFAGIMKGMEGEKLFVHCGGNVKSSGFLHLYQVLEEGRSEEESFGDLLKAQTPDEKWLDYFRSHGLEYRG